jgi:hypothetical protein
LKYCAFIDVPIEDCLSKCHSLSPEAAKEKVHGFITPYRWMRNHK